jgi:hypothetical protein
MTALLVTGVVVTGCDEQAGSPNKSFDIRTNYLAHVASSILLGTYTARRNAVASNNAMELLIRRCMQSHKLIYYPQLLTEPSSATQASSVQEFPPYGSLQQRERDGYGLAAATKATSVRSSGDAEDRYFNRLRLSAQARYEAVEYGPASDLVYLKLPGGLLTMRSGGCRDWAAVQIYGSTKNYMLSVSGQPRYFDLLLQLVDSSSTVQRALRYWASCMARSGFHYATPENAYLSISRQYLNGADRKLERVREIAVATADYECAARVSLIRVTLNSQRQLAAHLVGTRLSPVLEIAEIDIYAARRSARVWQARD